MSAFPRSGRFTPHWAERFVREIFGVAGTAEALGGYVDHNFHIAADDGRRYVLKLSTDLDESGPLQIQNRAMSLLSAKGIDGIEVPRPVAAVDGAELVAISTEAGQATARLLTFVEGLPLRAVPYLSPRLLSQLGSFAAAIVEALGEVGELDPASVWDIRRAREMMDGAKPHVRDPRAKRAETVLITAEAELERLRPSLRVGLIHADLTDENIIVDRDDAGRPRIRGVIDFGDMCRSWLVAELVAVATSCFAHAPKLATLVELARGFHDALPLRSEEVDAVVPLMKIRAAVAALETDASAAKDPGNEHLAAAVPWEWATFEAVAQLPPITPAALREVCDHKARPDLPAALQASETAKKSAAFAVVDGLDPDAPAIDFSPRSDAFSDGAWRDRSVIASAIASRRARGPVIGRYGEHRIIHVDGAGDEEPATLHLGVDVFADAGTAVRAPVVGAVTRSTDAGLILRTDSLFVHLRGITSSVPEGAQVQAGDLLGTIAAVHDSGLLPPHLHLQLCREKIDELPGLVAASNGELWRALCPDPSPLLWVSAEAPPEDPADELDRRQRVVASPQEHYYTKPPELVRGWQQLLYDSHGRAYLDVVNNVAVLGHSHPAVTDAARRQFDQINTNTRFLYRSTARFAEALLAVLPEPLEVVFFLNSGSEANDLALQLVRRATGRSDVIAFEGAYHGWTEGTAAISTHLLTNTTGTPGPHLRTVPQPYPFRDQPGHDARSSYMAAVRDQIAASLREGEGPAAFISEALVGVAGGVVLPDHYLEDVYRAVREAGGLCIVDEVQAGYGRVGEHFWAFEQQGVVPDVLTVAKCCGNGHPVAAVVTTRAIADRFGSETPWFSSVGGGPVSCEIGATVLQTIRAEGLQENARQVGRYFKARLEELVEHHPLCGAAHGMGLYLGLELVRDRDTLEPATKEARAICERMLALGVIVQPTGHFDSVLKLKPPLVFTKRDVDAVVERLDRVLATGWF